MRLFQGLHLSVLLFQVFIDDTPVTERILVFMGKTNAIGTDLNGGAASVIKFYSSIQAKMIATQQILDLVSTHLTGTRVEIFRDSVSVPSLIKPSVTA